MRGCERAGTAPRAPPPRGPAVPGGPHTLLRGPCTLPGGPCILGTRHAAANAPITCAGERALQPCGEHPPLGSDPGGASSLYHRGTYIHPGTHTQTTRPRRRHGRVPLPPETVLLSHSVHLPTTCCSETILQQTNHEVLLRNDRITARRRYDQVRDSAEKCSNEAILSRSAINVQVTSSQRRSLSSATAGWVLSCRLGALLLCLLLLASIRGGVQAGAGAGALGAGAVCARAPGLTERQRALCRAAPAAMPAIAAGLRAAFAECRAQLAGRRWNCSAVGDHNLFAHVVPLASREAAFTYALASAGVTHAVSAACARGDLPACGCAHRRRAVGGARCGGDAAYGARLARRFLDARELERDARALMNLHNNRLGRKMVKELVRVECKCHGVSGSCSVRTCWRALPPLGRVARVLRDKYERARQVEARGGGAVVLRRVRGGRSPRRSELVYLVASPAYCEPDAGAAAPGTHGRRCNRTSSGEDGCAALCCGRGHYTVRATQRVQCRCTFHWCCRVTCDTCLTTTDLHVCK